MSGNVNSTRDCLDRGWECLFRSCLPGQGGGSVFLDVAWGVRAVRLRTGVSSRWCTVKPGEVVCRRVSVYCVPCLLRV